MNKESAKIEPKLILQELMNAHYDERPKTEAYFKKQWQQVPSHLDARAKLNKDHMQENEDVREGKHMPPHAPEYIGTPMLRHLKQGFAKEAMKSGFSTEQTNVLFKSAINAGELWNTLKGAGRSHVVDPVKNIPSDWKAWGAAKQNVSNQAAEQRQLINHRGASSRMPGEAVDSDFMADWQKSEEARELALKTLSQERNKSLYGLGVAGAGLGGAGLAASSMLPSGGQQMPQDIQGGAENGAYPNNFQNT